MNDNARTPLPPGIDDPGLLARVDAVRAFNRYYVQRIGALAESILDTSFSAAEARVLYELAYRQAPTAAEIARDIGLDPGYLSRILRGFLRSGLVTKRRSARDGRQWLLTLTPQGEAAFAPLEAGARRHIASMISHLTPDQQQRLVDDLREVMALLAERG